MMISAARIRRWRGRRRRRRCGSLKLPDWSAYRRELFKQDDRFELQLLQRQTLRKTPPQLALGLPKRKE